MELVRVFGQLSKSDGSIAGGKGASLGEMTQAGIPVPPGFVLLTNAFERFLAEADLNQEIEAILGTVKHDQIHTVEHASEKIQALIVAAKMPDDIAKEITSNFGLLDAEYVAVRSSATAEDGSAAAWAGQLDTFLNTTKENLLKNVQRCWASLFTPRAIFYRFEKGMHGHDISVAVVVQKMVQSEVSGIAFSAHPVTEDYNQLIIEAGFGLGEAIVSGQVTPDSYVVEKEPCRIIDTNIATQTRGLYRGSAQGNEWKDISEPKASSQVLSNDQVLELSELILKIENHYGFPCDIEWACEGGKFYITQSRPITTLSGNSNTAPTQKGFPANTKIYKQEGRVGLYQVTLPYLTTMKPMTKYVPATWGEGFAYWKENYLTGYFYEDNLERVANAVLEAYKRGEVTQWLEEWKTIDKQLTQEARSLKDLDVTALSSEELYVLYLKLYGIQQKMWAISIFIDCFDAGLDQREIERISAERGLSVSEAHVLTTPAEPSFVSVWERMLSEWKRGKTTKEAIIEAFFWQGTNYSGHKEVDDDFLNEAAEGAHDVRTSSNEKEIENILKKHRLKENPLDFFRILTLWRDERKRLNHTGLYALIKTLKEVARRNNIPGELVNALVLSQIDEFFAGTISKKRLERQYKEGVLTTIQANGDFVYSFDQEAKSQWDNVLASMRVSQETVSEIHGTVANRGKIIGMVRVLNDFNDQRAPSFKSGDVLVTSMTRPEFLPLMKLASAFVTDEGGMTSHAAIVAREMGKPCIIGTKIATQVLKDGDEVEVDADNGIVRIIQGATSASSKEYLISSLRSQDWQKDWEGRFSLLLVSIANGASYLELSEKVLEIKLFPYIVAYKDGIATAWFPTSEYESIGTQLVKRYGSVSGAEELASKFMQAADDAIALFVKHKNSLVDAISDDSIRIDETYTSYQIATKTLANFLPSSTDPQVYEILERARKYSETFYKEMEEFVTHALSALNHKEYSQEMLAMLSLNELRTVLRGESLPGSDVLQNRVKRSGVYVQEGSFDVLSAQDVDALENAWQSAEEGDLLRGQSAFAGVVQGKCRVIKDFKGADIEQGEILVTGMTDPNFVPLMKKAAAIVTDGGGMLSHAAIVSRELRIPCVVGTKNASHILKDGDEVEVDADKGIVRKV